MKRREDSHRYTELASEGDEGAVVVEYWPGSGVAVCLAIMLTTEPLGSTHGVK